MNDRGLSGHTDLTTVEERSKLDRVGSVLEVGVFANDRGCLSSEFENDRLDVLAAERRDD